MTVRSLTLDGRLPGVRCSVALPTAQDPVRLDVTGFVGLAERGPLNVPVAVEDANQYAAVFGGDLAIASDDGVPVYAQLPAAVRAFFDNGGRRCRVVRVAGALARAARWAVPGLQVWQPDGTVSDAFVRAAWPGAWSHGARVAAQLLAQPLTVPAGYERGTAEGPGRLTVEGLTAASVGDGDIVRLDLGPFRPGLFLRIGADPVVDGRLPVTVEMPFDAVDLPPDGASAVVLPRPDLLATLPAVVTVRAAWLLRMDLLARGPSGSGSRLPAPGGGDQIERWTDLSLNGASGPSPIRRPVWTSALQRADLSQPDLTRSMLLRADPTTVRLLASGLAVPSGMDQLAGFDTLPDGTASLPSPDEPGDDDLGFFDPVQLYLDPALASSTIYSLVADADQLTVLSREPVALHGIHALMPVDEVGLVAVPDAAHRGWSQAPPVPEPPPPVPPEVQPVNWSRFRCCDVPPAVPGPPPDGGPPPVADETAGLPLLDPVAAFDEGPMLAVQVALVTLCAARADAVALLSLPRHYDTAAVLDWHERISSDGRLVDSGSTAASPLSHAGYWHPWARVLEPTTPQLSPLRDVAPDGAVAGMVAATELSRGVWVAPAARPLRGPVQVVPDLSPSDTVRLFDAHANLLTSRPGQVSTLCAHTLSDDPQMLQVSVRRLVVLLRKLALLHGQRYTFETNTVLFRQLVAMRFERVLRSLAAAGALVAFRVSTDDGTEQDGEAGRLVVALQIAPTTPVEFITVTLVRSGEDLLDVLEA